MIRNSNFGVLQLPPLTPRDDSKLQLRSATAAATNSSTWLCAVGPRRNSLAVAAAWAGAGAVELASAAARGKPVRFLFTMEDAWLYSIRFG